MTAIVQAERARLSRQEARVKRVVEAFTENENPAMPAGQGHAGSDSSN
jgi:hypothetical protein